MAFVVVDVKVEVKVEVVVEEGRTEAERMVDDEREVEERGGGKERKKEESPIQGTFSFLFPNKV
jgi:hypothetical protein